MYLALAARPDITFAVGQVAQFCEYPETPHWTAVKSIFAYVQGTCNYGLCFKAGDCKDLLGYTDADYADNLVNRKSTTGFVFFFNEETISWSSRRHYCVAMSTTEAEYVAASESAKEAIWLQRLMCEVGSGKIKPVHLLCDNQSAIQFVKNPEFHQKTKHIDVRYHFIRECQASGEISISYIETQKQMADNFTKPMAKPRFVYLRKKLGVIEAL